MDGISPFEYNRIVTAEHFIGRDKEVSKLKTLIKSKKNALLYGPPKIGKRSIVFNALTELQKENVAIEICTIDIFNIRSLEGFLIKLATVVLDHFAETEQEKEYLSRTYIKDIELDTSKGYLLPERQVKHLLEFPECVAEEYKVHLIIYMQQFQDILLFDKPLRAISLIEQAFTKTRNINFIIVGDKRNAMDSIFVEKQFFRNLVTNINIKNISKKVFCEYITERFAAWGKFAGTKEAGEIYDAMEGDPWYIQHLAEICFLLTRDKLTSDIVERGLQHLISIHDYELHNTVYGLSTHQIHLIKAILDGVRKFSKTDILEKYHLNSSANVNRLKEALTKKEIVTFTNKNLIEFNDTLLKMWLKKYFFS